jgi:ATP-dependent DNA helicase RecG
VNDYRNIVVAEAMKVLGFVNRHSRGVLRVQKELVANENGEAIYDFGYQTAVMVCEKKSPLGERMTAAAIANGFLLENDEIRSNSTILDEKQPQKVSQKVSRKVSKIQVPEFPSKIVEDVFNALKINPKARLSWLADNLGVSEITVKRAVSDLKELGYINSEHSKVKGVWQLLK